MATIVDEIKALCANAIEASDKQDAENAAGGVDEALDFGGNQDDALSYGETRGNRIGRAEMGREILNMLKGKVS